MAVGVASLQTFHRDATCHLATAPHLVVTVWRDAPRLFQLRRLRSAFADQPKREGLGSAFITVIESGRAAFSNEVREETAGIARQYTSKGLASAHVVLVEGLTGIATRSFISTVTLLGRSTVPRYVGSSVEAATEFIAPHLQRAVPTWTAPALYEAVQRARDR